jgi:glycerol-3-phosphate dehydrogenase subunit C
MTITYDPTHPKYFDEKDLRSEMDRVYDLCHGCRVCFKYCTSFPTLFEIVDAKEDQAAHLMTPAEQDKVVDECFQCKLCDINCPYTPSQEHEWMLDFPRLMLRASAIRKSQNGRKVPDHVFGNTDLLGKLNTLPGVSAIANKVIEKPDSPARKAIAKTLGISSKRMLLPYTKTRFSTWFKRRATPVLSKRQAKVALFPTCLVEYQDSRIGKDMVSVYEKNNVACSLPDGLGCCGAPWLHSGDFENFREQARKNIGPLSKAIKAGYDIVVPQPTCGYVLKKDYAAYFKGEPELADAELIGAHTFDASEYLWKIHKGDGTELDKNFTGYVPATTTYHVACHLQAQQIGLKSRDLMKLTGTKITLVNLCSGIDGTWGYREANYDIAKKVAKPLGEAVTRANSEVVTGDCHLANGAITEETGAIPMHPLSFMARAYGLPEQ